ncbi:hypothetical protein Tco_1558066, partial [Tanacetum coccineum]
ESPPQARHHRGEAVVVTPAGRIVVIRGGAPSQPDTTRCGCGGCHAVRPPPRGGARRRTTLRHHLGLHHHSPTPQGAAVVAVLSSDRHHDGASETVRRGDGNGGEVRVLVMVMGCMASVVAGCGGVGANWCFDGGACGGVVDRMKMVERMV